MTRQRTRLMAVTMLGLAFVLTMVAPAQVGAGKAGWWLQGTNTRNYFLGMGPFRTPELCATAQNFIASNVETFGIASPSSIIIEVWNPSNLHCTYSAGN